jgi:nicotinamidase-related amidase
MENVNIDATPFINNDKLALVVVDMQNDFCDPNGSFAKAGRDITSVRGIIKNISSLINTARQNGTLVVYLQQITLPEGKSDSSNWLRFKKRDGKSPEYTILGSEGAEIIEELAPKPNEVVIHKYRPSGFHGTFLDQILRANGIDSVLITGNTTEGCVMATALDASFHDYNTGIVKDGVASSVPKMQETALEFMKTRYKLISTNEVIIMWSNIESIR